MDFAQLFQQAKAAPDMAAAFALVGLSGLHPDQISQADINPDRGYVRTQNDDYFILSQQAIDLLQTALPINEQQILSGMEALGIEVETSHQALANAIWETSEEGRLLQDMIAMGEHPALPLSIMYPFSIVGQLQPDDSRQMQESRLTLQTAVDWLLQEEVVQRSLISKLLDGKLVFLVISTGVSGLNLFHNLIMGRLLNPAAYGQLTFFITLLLIVGLIPTAMQTVSARYSAVYAAQYRDDWLRQIWQFGIRTGWVIGLLIMGALLLFAPYFTRTFELSSPWLMLPVALGVPFFLGTGTERGILQGKEKYYWLSAAYLMEGVIRLGVGVLLALLLMDAGRALDGAVWALTQSLVLTWWVAFLGLRLFNKQASRKPYKRDVVAQWMEQSDIGKERSKWIALFGFTSMALIGQALITNSDFILVKTFFGSFDAGLYAAISVIGRIVYFGTLPLTILIVPMIARKQTLGESTRTLLILLMGSGALLCGGLIGASALFAPQIVGLFYGEAYLDAAYLLPMYTVAAALFVMTNLLVTYRVALGKGSETWMPLVAGFAQIIGVIMFHENLQQVILVQITIMTCLFTGVAWRATR